jgi:hypothetical protein
MNIAQKQDRDKPMREKSTGSLHIICPHLGVKNDKTTAFAFPAPGNICYNCKIPTSPSEIHQKKFCLTTARNECPVYNQDKNKPFPPNLSSVRETSQNSYSLWDKVLWISLGLIVILVISYLISIYLHSGKIEVPPFLLTHSISVSPTPGIVMLTKFKPMGTASYAYTQILLNITPIPTTVSSTAILTSDQATTIVPTITSLQMLK